MKSGLVVVSGTPEVRLEGRLREAPDEPVDPPPRCAVAEGASKAITSAIHVLNRQEPSAIAAFPESLKTFK